VAPFPTILTLENSRVHVYSSNDSNIVAYVETPVVEYFDIAATLYISYINLNDCYVGFWRDFDDSKL